MEKIYLTQAQKEYIWESLDLDEGLEKGILKLTWYVEENDWEENCTPDGVNVFPYSVVAEEIDYLIDCISKETFEDTLNINNQFEYKERYYYIGKVENFYTGVIFELHEEDMDELIDWFIWDEIELVDAIKMAKDLIDIYYKEKKDK